MIKEEIGTERPLSCHEFEGTVILLSNENKNAGSNTTKNTNSS